MIKFLKKIAGILDKPRDTMAVDVWTSDKKIVPQVKEQLLKKLYSFVPKNVVKEVFTVLLKVLFKALLTKEVNSFFL